MVAGFQPIMPTFQGLVTEEQLLQLIAYIKSLGAAVRRRRDGAAGDPDAIGATGRAWEIGCGALSFAKIIWTRRQPV